MKGKVLFSTIVSLLCFSLSTMGIMAAVPKNKKTLKDNEVVVKSNVEEMTVEETTQDEALTAPYEDDEDGIEEETKKKKKLKTVNISDDDYNNSSDDDYSDYNSGNNYDNTYDDSSYSDNEPAVNNYYYGDTDSSSNNKKRTTSKKKKYTVRKNNRSKNNTRKKKTYKAPKIKKKAISSQSEKNVLSSSKVNLLRSQIKHKVSGSSNGELTNLAKYMANNNLSNADSTYRKLTNVDGNVSCATYKLKVSTNDQLAILEAANKIKELSAGKYGIGISSTEANVGYKIYVVICYK